MVSVLASNEVDRVYEPIESNQRLKNWYLLLLHLTSSIKEQEQRLFCWESGYCVKSGGTCQSVDCCLSELALKNPIKHVGEYKANIIVISLNVYCSRRYDFIGPGWLNELGSWIT